MENKRKNIRRWTVIFMIVLFLSGVTAMPVETELAFLTKYISPDTAMGSWLHKVYSALAETNTRAGFLAYGYDWLAFAHFLLAILFTGVYRDPVRNKWIIEFGMIACYLVIPLAFVAGHYRGIPIGWRLIDCSFGVLGLIPLVICHRMIGELEKMAVNAKEVWI